MSNRKKMVKNNLGRKPFTITTIYVPEEDLWLVKEIKKIAKKDKRIDKEIREKRSSMLSYVTVMLWRTYVRKYKEQFEQKGGIQEDGETNDASHTEEDQSSNQEPENA